jgi:hypothetical protein
MICMRLSLDLVSSYDEYPALASASLGYSAAGWMLVVGIH